MTDARVLYNDNDAFACTWLRELVDTGELPAGDILERDIRSVRPADLASYRHVHLFAGIGGWPLALRLAGWPAERKVWTASCPCQPFSAAGRHAGVGDERHLWPVVRDLVAECRPATVFGEQVASRAGRQWLVGVRADLEALGYAVGAADLCAASVGAPHIRQRLFWVAHADGGLRRPHRDNREDNGQAPQSPGFRAACRLAHADGGRLAFERFEEHRDEQSSSGDQPDGRSAGRRREGKDERMGSPNRSGLEGFAGNGQGRDEPRRLDTLTDGSAWAATAVIDCSDGKLRRAPLEPSLRPLADGISNRVGTLRGAGNAIVPQIAAVFVRAAM